MSNTELWDKVRRVPREHLKPFDNGKFKGTAIKPMWAVQVMTENFGPMGTGWGVLHYSFRTEDVAESRLVFCESTVWYGTKEHTVQGIGGDWLVRNGKGDDEAMKKAYTDALTNALKHLGVAADIHMNLWDGSKYKDEKPEPQPAPKNDEPPFTKFEQPAEKKPQLLTREEARRLYKQLETELVKLETAVMVQDWIKMRDVEINKLGDWNSYIDKAIEGHVQFVTKKAFAEAAE